MFAIQGTLGNLDQRATRETMEFKGQRETLDRQDLLELQGLLATMGRLAPPAKLERKEQQGHQVHQVRRKVEQLASILLLGPDWKRRASCSGAKGSVGPTGAPGDEGPPGPPGNRGQVFAEKSAVIAVK
jgi:hypothetical protein